MKPFVIVAIAATLAVSACSGSNAPAPTAPENAMSSYEDETARIRAALSESVRCWEEVVSADPNSGRRRYYCQSEGDALGLNLLFLSSGAQSTLRLYATYQQELDAGNAVRAELESLLAAYGYAANELERCASEPQTDVLFDSHRVNCTTHGISSGSYEIAIVKR